MVAFFLSHRFVRWSGAAQIWAYVEEMTVILPFFKL